MYSKNTAINAWIIDPPFNLIGKDEHTRSDETKRK